MKQMKKILYLLAMLIAIIVLIFAGTGIVQTGLVIISKKMQIAMSEDLLYHISGSCGVMIAGIICAVYVKKKNYVQNIGKVETFSLKKAFYLAGLTVCICRIIINEINDSTRNINYCIVAHAFCNLFASVMNALEQMEITCFGMALQYEKNGYVMCHFILV